MHTILLLTFITFSAPLHAASPLWNGNIFNEKNEHEFLVETSSQVEGETTTRNTRYTDKKGQLLVEEDFQYVTGKLNKYVYKQLQMDEGGTLEIRDGKIHYSFTAQGKTKTDDSDVENDMLLSDGIGDYIRTHWDALMNGESLKVRYLLLERLDSVGFKFSKIGERKFNGVDVIEIKMKPSSIIIAALAPSIRFSMEKQAPHRMLEIVGRLPIRIPEVENPKKRRDYRALDGRMEIFYPEANPPPRPGQNP